MRNLSTNGPFASYHGDRVPNMPWLFGGVMLRTQVEALATATDELSLSWFSRYVHQFYRDWESNGAPEYRQVVDSQLVHSLAVTYVLRGATSVSSSFEVQNLTDEKVYDVYGVQKPGRAFYVKITFDM